MNPVTRGLAGGLSHQRGLSRRPGLSGVMVRCIDLTACCPRRKLAAGEPGATNNIRGHMATEYTPLLCVRRGSTACTTSWVGCHCPGQFIPVGQLCYQYITTTVYLEAFYHVYMTYIVPLLLYAVEEHTVWATRGKA